MSSMIPILITKLPLMDNVEETLTLLIGRIIQVNTLYEINDGFNSKN
jgi:hypothetical protein